jgi:hypothetical protein
MKTLKIQAVIGLVSIFALASFESSATPLNLVPGLPDFGSFNVTLSYDVGSGTFQAQGYTLGYINPAGINSLDGDYTGPFVPDYADYGFNLNAHVTTAGVLTGGTVTILGCMDSTGETVDTLLTGDLKTGADGVAFGSLYFPAPDTGGDRFEFLFKVTGGNSTIVSDFGGITGNYNGGIVLAPMFGRGDTLFTGSWTTSFNNEMTANGNVDTVLLVPEPSSVLLLAASGVMGMMARRWRRKVSGI